MIKPLSLAALLAVSVVFLPLAGRADDPVPLTRALAAAAKTDWDQAAAEARLAGPLAFDLVEWQRLRAGKGSFADYADFAARRGDWPGMELLRKKGEAQLAGANPVETVAYFGEVAPQTGTGALALIAARQAMGQPDKAAAVAEAAWRSLDLTPEEQAAFLARHADLVAPFHGGRMQAALDQGPSALLPLTMAEIADALDLHESTVSRVVAGASVDTPLGTWWLRRLFSGRLGEGGPSAAAIRAAIARLVAAEPPSAPLSDGALTEALAAEGFVVARRTVAKYREMLNIPPGHRRRRRPSRVA
mgnify:CR=1 FL=1